MIRPIINEEIINRLRALLNGAKQVVITCHLSPDGDAVGSSLALCHILRRLGKDASVVTPDMVPRALQFLPGMRDITVYTQQEARAKRLIDDAQLIFCLDFNTLRRIDKMADAFTASAATKILIDHHEDPEDIFVLQISFPELSSTCELLYRVLLQLHMLNLIDRDAAQALYLGMMTDTGNFTYGSDNPEIYEILASLMRRRFDKQWIYNMAMNTFSADCLRLQGYAIDKKMELLPDVGGAFITLTRQELKQYHYRKGDTEGLVNKPLAIPGVDWVIFMREDADYIKVSCRSQGNFSVNELCNKYFHGGGHLNAAGGEYHGSMEEAVASVLEIANEIKNNPELFIITK